MTDPANATLLEQAKAHHAAGRLPEAHAAYSQFLAHAPDHAEALYLLGTLACQTRAWEPAVELLSRATRSDPNNADAWNNLGTALRNLGRNADAVNAYERAVAAAPSTLAHENLVTLLLAMREPQRALEHARRALQLDPARAQAHCYLAMALADLARFAEALPAAQRALQLDPQFPEARCVLSGILRDSGDPTAAEREARAALAINPNAAAPRLLLAQALWKLDRLTEASEQFEHVIQMNPNDPAAHLGLAGVRRAQGRVVDSITSARRSIELDPDNPRTWNILGSALRDEGWLPEAIQAYREAIRITPAYLVAHDNLCWALHFDSEHTPEQILQEHQRWSQQHEIPLMPQHVDHPNSRDPNRRLRVAYVSAAFSDHAIGRNLLPPILAHDRDRVEVVCYSDVTRPDTFTARFKAAASEWYDVARLSHDALAEKVRADRIDILVDLSVHLAGNRLPAFARHPAPVQVSHMSYPATTGMRSIRYRITDPHIDPPGATESFNTEQLVRLPHSFWCYFVDEQLPDCGDPPVVRNRFVTFGSLNNPSKVSKPCAGLWSRVLHAVKGSKLMLLVYDVSGENEYFTRTFGEFGIPRERLIFVRQRPRPKYLELYREIDIVLDTLPYNGHSTSLDALLMGVPIVTLPGITSVSRAGASFLRNIAEPQLIAADSDGFVNIASTLAADLERLRALRKDLRERTVRSPLCDGKSYAQALENVYRQMWQQWCGEA